MKRNFQRIFKQNAGKNKMILNSKYVVGEESESRQNKSIYSTVVRIIFVSFHLMIESKHLNETFYKKKK